MYKCVTNSSNLKYKWFGKLKAFCKHKVLEYEFSSYYKTSLDVSVERIFP